MLLSEFATMYADSHEYGLRASSVVQIKSAIASFRRWLGREPEFRDLNSATVNSWTEWLNQNRRPDTVRTTRGTILTLWRAAADQCSIPAPVKVRKLRKAKHNPLAWRAQEILDLVNTIDPPGMPWKSRIQKRLKNGLPFSLFFSSLILAGYDTGIRLGDLLRLRWCDLRFSKSGGVSVSITTSKTGDTVFRELSPRAVSALEDFRKSIAAKDSDVIWPLWGRREAFYKAVRKIVERAGITRGTFRFLRRAAVTQSDIVSFGSGQKIAGHRDARVTAESYRDQAQVNSDPMRAPDLVEAAKRESRQAS